MRVMSVTVWRLLLLGLVASALPALAREVPALTERVVDQADLMSGDERVALEQKLADFEQRTGIQVAVLTVQSLEGDTIEAFSMHVAEAWKLGSKEKDNGVLFTVAKDDRKMRIEVGYGLESRLTDAVCGRILDNVVRAKFRAGDFPGGVGAGVDSILGTLEGTPGSVPDTPASSGPYGGPLGPRLMAFGLYLLVTGVFSLIALLGRGGVSWFLFFFLMPFHLLFPMVLHPFAGPLLFFSWLVLFPIVKLVQKLRDKPGAPKKASSGWASVLAMAGNASLHSGGSSGGGWSSGGSSGGSSFSGGGGSFGGGGSSSSW